MNIQIKAKKDWVIAFIFALLIVYGISTRFSYRLQSLLLEYGNSKLTNMNQPRGYGNLIITALVMTIIAEILLIVYRKSIKIKIFTLLAGMLCAVLLFAGYLFNCNLIVSVIDIEKPVSVRANGWGTDINLNMNTEQQDKLVSYCETLEPVPADQEKELENVFYADGNMTSNSLLIWITYPKKYGHNYDLMVCVYDNMIFVRKGYNNRNKEIVTFYKDNGLLSLINQMKE
jgi:hypothetical protein